MRRIEEHKRLDDDRQLSKGKASTTSQYNKDTFWGLPTEAKKGTQDDGTRGSSGKGEYDIQGVSS